MSGIFYHIDQLGSALNASEKSHRVVSENIANVNTPGFKTKRLEFERLLDELQATESRGAADDPLPVKDLEGLVEL